MPIARFGPSPDFPLSLAVRAGDVVTTSTLGARVLTSVEFSPDGTPLPALTHLSLEQEAEETFAAVISALARAGALPEQVTEVTVWLRAARDFPAMNRAFVAAFGTIRPARTVLQNSFMYGYRIEAKATAFLG
jgi:enamine deaminase RidA (YjgF/YER057c/UK114 family)